MIKPTVLVIGGGASGMMAAIAAARKGVQVTLLEHKDRIGRKLLSTGNGKCNLTNQIQHIDCYRGEDPAFAMAVYGRFDVVQTMKFFSDLGIFFKSRDSGYYPNCEQASSVLDVLRMEIRRLPIAVELGVHIKRLEHRDGFFTVYTYSHSYQADALILAAGSAAAPATGSDGSGYQYATQFGHKIVDVVPALVPLRAKQSYFKGLKGVRTQARLTLLLEGQAAGEETGQLQLTEYGLSGIPTFQLSRFAARALREKKKVRVLVDFLPGMEEKHLLKYLPKRFALDRGKTLEEAMIGLLHKQLSVALIKEAGLSLQMGASQLREQQIQQLVTVIKALPVDIVGCGSMDEAQVCAGGVSTAQINPETMESLLEHNLYFAGEMVDVDGMCGGYNLQWAWSSGYVAGSSAAARFL